MKVSLNLTSLKILIEVIGSETIKTKEIKTATDSSTRQVLRNTPSASMFTDKTTFVGKRTYPTVKTT